jgi:hypothetical protein
MPGLPSFTANIPLLIVTLSLCLFRPTAISLQSFLEDLDSVRHP